jgi:hypothetical protein
MKYLNFMLSDIHILRINISAIFKLIFEQSSPKQKASRTDLVS